MVKQPDAAAMAALDARGLLLFVPADRPERFAKAAAANPDAVIIDLEDAVAPECKESARDGLGRALASLDTARTPFLVRINAAGTPWHEEDVTALAGLPLKGAMLPKAESAADLTRLSRTIGNTGRVIALIETARGVAVARKLAEAADRIAFGSIDFAADIGAEPTRDALLYARSELVLASRLADLPGPIEGVTVSVSEVAEVEDDARYAASLGFRGKLLIHPAQVALAVRGFMPSQQEIAWAERVIGECADGGVTAVDGQMIDAPVRARAEQILRRVRSER